MNVIDKITFVKPVRQYCILKAKTGQNGIILRSIKGGSKYDK